VRADLVAVVKLYACTNHDGHWPVGVASVVYAYDEVHARRLLDEALGQHGLKPHAKVPYDFTVVALDKPFALVLCDGDY
jgi:hypothetical protein